MSECSRKLNVWKKNKVCFVTGEGRRGRHAECQRAADEAGHGGAGPDPALSPPRHLSSGNIAQHKHY